MEMNSKLHYCVNVEYMMFLVKIALGAAFVVAFVVAFTVTVSLACIRFATIHRPKWPTKKTMAIISKIFIVIKRSASISASKRQ